MKQIITMYHGTFLKHVSDIIEHNYHITNSKNWMGRGAYFFLEDIFAFTWCLDLYRNEISQQFDEDDFKENMAILVNIAEIDSERILDLSYFEGQEIIDSAYKKLLSNKKYRKKLEEATQNQKMAIILEILFEKVGFKKNYDAVRQIYRLHVSNYNNIFSPREKGIPQHQVCIKNNSVIKNISVFKYEDKIETYKNKWKNMINDTTFRKICGEYDSEEYTYLDNKIDYYK